MIILILTMNDLINIIYEYNPHNIYIRIGSAPCIERKCDSRNRQNFPPYIEKMTEQGNVMVINIDPNKYQPTFLTKFPNLIQIEYSANTDIWIQDNLIFVFINESVDLNINTNNSHLNIFDTINKYV